MKNHDSAGDGALILSFSVKEGHKIHQGMPEVDEIVTIFRYSVYPLKNRTLGWSVSGKAKAYWLTPLDILLPLKHRTHPSEKWEGKLKNSGIPIAITLPLIKDMNLWIPSFASLGGMPMPIKGQKSIFCAMYILMKSNVFPVHWASSTLHSTSSWYAVIALVDHWFATALSAWHFKSARLKSGSRPAISWPLFSVETAKSNRKWNDKESENHRLWSPQYSSILTIILPMHWTIWERQTTQQLPFSCHLWSFQLQR